MEPGLQEGRLISPIGPGIPMAACMWQRIRTIPKNPFNGKRSQKIELPVAHTWAGISQDGFYLDAGHSYRLRLHMRSSEMCGCALLCMGMVA